MRRAAPPSTRLRLFAEDYRFARRVAKRDRKLIFIGPSWKIIRELGDKINTKRLARSLGVAHCAWV